MRTYFIFITHLLMFVSCKGQSYTENKGINPKNEENAGIVYFSVDNGNTWKNASSGIPQQVRIGLGGVASSGAFLGIATKEYGIFEYNLKESIWGNIPTEQQIIDANIGAMVFYKNTIYVGTQYKGVFCSNDKGKTWNTRNAQLNNLTIRRFFEFDDKLYVCTNDGFYVLDEKTSSWTLEMGENVPQVNGATVFQKSIYIATNRGIFKKDKDQTWENVLPNHSVHQVSSDSNLLYGMTYTALLLSSKDGMTWQNMQDGLPKGLYTFNVLNQHGTAFAGQWDGVYKRTNLDFKWAKSSNGLPANFAVTNLQSFNGILVASTSERKLKLGMTIEK